MYTKQVLSTELCSIPNKVFKSLQYKFANKFIIEKISDMKNDY